MGPGPGAELLPVVAHHPEALAVLGGVLAEVVQQAIHLTEGDAITQALLRPEDRKEVALVVGRVRPPHLVLRDGRTPQVVVVQDRPAIAGPAQVGRERRFPDPLGQPGARRPAPEMALDLVGHEGQLGMAVTLRKADQHGLVIGAAQHLDLIPRRQRPDPLDGIRMGHPQPLEQRSAVVEADPDARMPLERPQQGFVGLAVDVLEDPAEVADGLMVMDDQGEGDAAAHRRAQPASVTTRRRAGRASTATPAAVR